MWPFHHGTTTLVVPSQHPNDDDDVMNDANPTTTGSNGTAPESSPIDQMIPLPKGTMRHRYQVVTYIGIIVTVFLVGAILFAISMATIHNKTDSSSTSSSTSTTSTSSRKEFDVQQKRDMYRYYSNLIVTQVSVRTLRPASDIRVSLLLPTTAEYQALQWLFRHQDDITMTSVFDSMTTTTTTTATSTTTTVTNALLQRFAVTTMYLHFQLQSYMTPHVHECEWKGITCQGSRLNHSNNDDDTSAEMITGINITSLLSLPSSSGTTTTGNQTSEDVSSITDTTTTTTSHDNGNRNGPILGTTIPVSICYISSILTSIDLSRLDLVGTIPMECYTSNMWNNIQDIYLEQNQLQQFFTLPIATTTTTTMNQTVWWPNIRSIHVGSNLLNESIIDTTTTVVVNNNNSNNNNKTEPFVRTTTTITTSILHWNQLEYLNVQGNNDLTGKLFETNCLSSDIWPNIQVLDISETGITGIIPDPFQDNTTNNNNNTTTTTIMMNGTTYNANHSTTSNTTGMLSQLTTFAAYRVPLSGSIPNVFGSQATNLQVLALGLSDNVWTGTLPESYGHLTALKQLSLSHLNGITGTLPESWGYGMTQLQSLDLFGNPHLSGSIPNSWGGMTSLATLRLAQTNINGTIPSELGQLTRLVDASFHRTNLHGSVPTEICQLRKDYVLTKLSVDCIADTLVSNSIEQAPPVTCSKPDCCTSCT